MWKKFGFVVLAVVLTLLSAPSAFAAVNFDLVPPSGTLTRGSDITFTINITTNGETVTSVQNGLTYDTQFLEYVSSAPGPAMTNLTVDTSQGTGKLLFTGTNSSGFTGTGIFATVVFKLIAEESGQTDLCTLWTPTPTTPPAQCNSSCTSNTDCSGGMYCYVVGGQTTGFCRNQTCPDQTNCTCIQPTSPPVPTALPQSGFELPQNSGAIAGALFLAAAAGVFMYTKKSAYTRIATQHTHHKKASPKADTK